LTGLYKYLDFDLTSEYNYGNESKGKIVVKCDRNS